MRAAVTGASGLVGSHLVAALRRRAGDEIVDAASDGRRRLPPRRADDRVATPTRTRSRPSRRTSRWRGGTVARRRRRAVFASTDQVYGPRPPVPVDRGRAARARGAVRDEQGRGRPARRAAPPGAVVARLVNVYGPGDRHDDAARPGHDRRGPRGAAPGRPRRRQRAARPALRRGRRRGAARPRRPRGARARPTTSAPGRRTASSRSSRRCCASPGSDLEPDVRGRRAARRGRRARARQLEAPRARLGAARGSRGGRAADVGGARRDDPARSPS